MNIEFIRSILYPLGLVGNVFFSMRFFLQWIQSEKKKKSHVTKTFWILSIAGNAVMTVHSFIQLQFPLYLIQAFNGLIAWRNLDLMDKKSKTLNQTLIFFASTLFILSLLFLAQGFFIDSLAWMREPSFFLSKSKTSPVSFAWHLLGLAAMTLFASRFWIQWWMAEKQQKSFLGKSFWWTSLIGALFSLIYFVRLNDWVNILGYSVGLLPYLRNLFLLKKETKSESETAQESSLFIFAGEQSGDFIGGNLISSLKKQNPSLKIWGVGGSHMKKAGLETFSDISKFHVMGFSEVVLAAFRLFREFRKIRREILIQKPKACVFIDYPDFNMKMASSLKKKGYSGKLIHYVCPSVWAWRKNRISHLANTLDMLLTILPFEKKYFKDTALDVTYVGHPLISSIDSHPYTADWKKQCGILSDKPILALFPGSRKGEIQRNLPLQIEALKPFQNDYIIAVSAARRDLEEEIAIHAKGAHIVPHLFRYELMKDAKGALATSGTVILELGLHATPTVATYRIGLANYLLGRYIFKIILPFYTLVNIISEKEVFPEFIHKDISAKDVSKSFATLLENQDSCKEACKKLRVLLQEHNASDVAAIEINRVFHAVPLS